MLGLLQKEEHGYELGICRQTDKKGHLRQQRVQGGLKKALG